MTQQIKPSIRNRSKLTAQQAPPFAPRLRRSVLLADDDTDIVDFLKEVLTGAGYETCEAFDGEQAVTLYQACHPNAVLLDVAMPRLDGLEALGRIRRIDPSARVAMLTG